jgi:hypothetical protein
MTRVCAEAATLLAGKMSGEKQRGARPIKEEQERVKKSRAKICKSKKRSENTIENRIENRSEKGLRIGVRIGARVGARIGE